MQFKVNTDECLFEFIGNGSVSDYFVIASIPTILLVIQVFLLYPLKNIIQTDTDKKDGTTEKTSWKEYKKTFRKEFKHVGLTFEGYIRLISLACISITIGSILLAFSVEDPRPVWKEHGWKQSINGTVMIIVCISSGNDILGWFAEHAILDLFDSKGFGCIVREKKKCRQTKICCFPKIWCLKCSCRDSTKKSSNNNNNNDSDSDIIDCSWFECCFDESKDDVFKIRVNSDNNNNNNMNQSFLAQRAVNSDNNNDNNDNASDCCWFKCCFHKSKDDVLEICVCGKCCNNTSNNDENIYNNDDIKLDTHDKTSNNNENIDDDDIKSDAHDKTSNNNKNIDDNDDDIQKTDSWIEKLFPTIDMWCTAFEIIFFSIRYPYIVCYGMFMIPSWILYFIITSLWPFKKCFKGCLKCSGTESCRNPPECSDAILGVLCFIFGSFWAYFFIIAMVFLATDGIDNTDFCVSSNSRIYLAIFMQQIATIITVAGKIIGILNGDESITSLIPKKSIQGLSNKRNESGNDSDGQRRKNRQNNSNGNNISDDISDNDKTGKLEINGSVAGSVNS